MPSTNLANALQFDYKSIEEAFPKVSHGHTPCMSNYLVQVRRAKTTTAGGIFVPEESRKSEAANTTVAKVVALGPLCFKNARDLKPWPEGPSFDVGDYLRIPRYGGFRFSVKHAGEEIDFVLFDHLQQLAKLEDPMTVISYL